MNRRELVTASAAALAAGPALAQPLPPLPASKMIKVAFLLGDNANVIDTAGPWEVFQDAMFMADGRHQHPFFPFTVAPTLEPVRMTGGLLVQPAYSIDTVPQPDVIVVPAQRSTEPSRAWLRAASDKAHMTMSVCTGAFQLGRIGLLDGLPATTHHEFFDDFAKEFPKVALQRGPRFVDTGRIATAGGLTSGIDLALHVVGRCFGPEVRKATARYLEHAGGDWRQA
ncbi:DJ-1/PfpI family protein [Phenylobacterium sp.]|uniref:DJ-1/PfpI family protein n=1 Tax=Phenylobacterium sp. TaxID=1871053 RepID=UPI002C522FE4|nr:DJ-1/PfpI family protein [Phenylobacterium sp.]HVI34261.1 DJ-1/PfpI family protein [Phenylobacterium sp.]